jgi:glycosyltransferase involved in cell wall biosynthesis
VTFWAPYLGWLARRLARRHRLIYLCHNVYPHEAAFFDRPLVRFALKPAGRFIVHSEENRRHLLQLFPKARVLRQAHPAYGFSSLSEVRPGEARRRLDLHGRMLLFFGFIRAYKGLDLAIEALAKVKDDLPDLSLWICGEFWDHQRKYERLIEHYGLQNRVRIEVGYLPQSDLALRVAACDGVLLPYRSVTGSGILGNAFAMNKPVIAANIGSLGEMVEPGRSGLLCKPNDSAALAQAIRDFYSGEGPKRFADGVEKAKAQFSWDGIVRAIEELAQDG